jgi:nucleotide-binding universal stress UspA family protein
MKDRAVLICYDGSHDARRAVDYVAQVLPASRVIVLDVAPVLTAAESLALMTPGTVGAVFEESNQQDAYTQARAGAALAREAGLEATAHGTLAAPTWAGVLDVADEVDAAMIVVGARGHSGLRELREGSLAHALVEHSGRPLLIVPPPRRRD